MGNRNREISNLFIAGINYKKSDAAVRGLYAINPEQYRRILESAPGYGINELFVLSTCNRTEIYGFADNARSLCKLLCSQTTGTIDQFESIAYIRQGNEAIEHLFDVAAGLDSQILGDYEIVGQIKQAVKFSKENNFIGAHLDRLINSVLQASKEIKVHTELSGGTISVSFAAVQYIKENVADASNKKILLLGTGKIGRNTCKNLVDYLKNTNITLLNRTIQKAQELADALGLRVALPEMLESEVAAADIILVATNSIEPVIIPSHFRQGDQKLLIDLSIPCNIAPEAQELKGIDLINVDTLSKIKDETLHKREAEVPKAKAIIAQHMTEYFEWHEMRRYAPVLKAVKNKLEELHKHHMSPTAGSCESLVNPGYHTNNIQKVINGMAVKMRNKNEKGCYYIQAINEYVATGTN